MPKTQQHHYVICNTARMGTYSRGYHHIAIMRSAVDGTEISYIRNCRGNTIVDHMDRLHIGSTARSAGARLLRAYHARAAALDA